MKHKKEYHEEGREPMIKHEKPSHHQAKRIMHNSEKTEEMNAKMGAARPRMSCGKSLD
jgi:hypothetical protein